MPVSTVDASSARILDNPAWAALTGPHTHFAERIGHAARYHPDVAPFHAVSDGDDPRAAEISAVCTDPAHRGRGLATRLVRAVAAGIKERGERPFLHARADNATAIRLYQSIGFTLRRRTVFSLVRLTEAAVLEETA
ncbi:MULTISPECIES: GNAT family N-acetyltransferase [unclassified Streptomyces]|uniref:GNAT family N-acetyltransferase n=1 Tax=unclassified Streptomyces TaxID=2593676 RepID=UPI0036FDD204